MNIDISFIDKLEKRLNEPLPGELAQDIMAPAHHYLYREIPPDYKTASVLALLLPKNKEWHLALIERNADDPHDKHAGQLSLPGGKLDEIDYTLEDCAIRETYEEIGVEPSSIGILGALSPLYVFVSNFMVYPFVGFTTDTPKYSLQKSEVSDLIEIPLSFLTNTGNKSKTDIIIREQKLTNVPYYKVKNKILWGATAMILSEFEYLLSELED
ncbi:MAG: CoA pyrophosphatase [Saprospiraceae bacterium]|nr:CoA pyrophosphatase [Saprospiraceae bacterium]